MKAIVFIFVFLGVVIYGGWTGFMTLQHYMKVVNLVTETVERELPKVSGAGWQPIDRDSRIQESIVESGSQAGIPIEASAVSVTEESNVVAVRVQSPYTVVRYQDKVLSVPVSATRSFPLPAER